MIEAALKWLENGYWPIPISPLVTGGKKPLGGTDWGKYPPTPETLHILYATNPGAGLGLLLGDPRRLVDGVVLGRERQGIVDLDVDDPVTAASVLTRLFPDGIPNTRSWLSNRGGHWLFTADFERLKRHKKTIIKGGTSYPGIELRIGTYDYKHPVQLQTVIPPSLKADGTPRVWAGGPDTLPLPETVYADLEQNPGKQKQSKKPTAATYVWPPDTPPETIVIGKLLGGIDPTDTELAPLTPETRALVGYLHVVEPTSERYWMLLSYPVSVPVPGPPPNYNLVIGTIPPPGYRWKAPADAAKAALVERILHGLPDCVERPSWAGEATKTAANQAVVTQVGTPTWTPTLPKGNNFGRGSVDFDKAAQTFDLGVYLGLGPNGGKILCPAHPDTRPSLSIYHAHDRWHYRCWSCGVHGDSIAYLAHTTNCSRYEAARRILRDSRLPQTAPGALQPGRPPAYTNPCWQLAVVEVINYAHSELTGTETGREARAHLHSRGLTEETITTYRLGWNRKTIVLNEIEDWPQGLIIPRGILIPWLLPGKNYTDQYDENSPIYAGFNVRLLGTPHLSDPPTTKNGGPAPKYISAQGSTRIYPYPHSAIRVPGAPLLVVEGEFDALLATQILGDRFNVVTWTSASTDPARAHVPAEYWAGTRWYLLFDADAAGQAAAHRWREVHPTAKLLTYPPGVNDFGEMCASGGVTWWLEQLQL